MDRGQRMAERPLLLFPQPEEASRANLGGGSANIPLPTHSRQGERVSPMFHELWKAFETRRVEILRTTTGIDPEQTIVIETIGSVEGFVNAVKHIQGLEWMGEFDIDDIAPDDDFRDEREPDKRLNGRLYLMMANQQALHQMLSLWQSYSDDPSFKFGHGFARFRDIFDRLKSIRLWGVKDRFLETGIVEVLRRSLELDRKRPVRLEIELWFHRGVGTRRASEERVACLLQRYHGEILSESSIDEIAYHGLLVELPVDAVQDIVDKPDSELTECDDVMFFRPKGQMIAEPNPIEGESLAMESLEEVPLLVGGPVVALLDGYPLENHRWLAGRLRIDDPDGFREAYSATQQRAHGTSMASLIIHGDRNENGTPLANPLYIRPIMKPVPQINGGFIEEVPDDCLVVDLIHRAVKKMFEGEAAEGPSAPTVRIINLSIGDHARQFTQSMSPLARLLDWLSAKYGVLFIVSAGNHVQPVCLGVSRGDFEALQLDAREAAIVKELYRDASHRRLLSPAESINGLTVGAVHDDASAWQPTSTLYDPFVQTLPSPISAFGSGYRHALKPDIVFSGGRVPYQEKLQQPTDGSYAVEPNTMSTRSHPPGNLSARPGRQPGDLADACYTCGTSNATALISHVAGLCCESLGQILDAQAAMVDSRVFEAPLLKAMLVHGSLWNDTSDRISDILRGPDNGDQLVGLVSRWIGYGTPEIGRVLDCTAQRATLLGYGQLPDGMAHVFHLPLPPSLSSSPIKRRLIVTLAWLSPIAVSTQRYRTASMWFGVDGIMLAQDREGACGGRSGWRMVRRGTLQHEVFEGTNAQPFVDGAEITIKVNCRGDAGRVLTPVPYGIVVSLEVAEGTDIAIYDEIRTRIAPRVLIQPAAEDHRE